VRDLPPQLAEVGRLRIPYSEVYSVYVREKEGTLITTPQRTKASEQDSQSPSRMVDKQLWQTLKNGQLITFLVFDGEPVTGYLAGMDDEAYFVLEPRGDKFFRKIIIKKHGNPQFEIHRESTYSEELPWFEDMERIIAPYRTFILHNRLGQQNKSGTRPRNVQR
jgi:hypothetical protein